MITPRNGEPLIAAIQDFITGKSNQEIVIKGLKYVEMKQCL